MTTTNANDLGSEGAPWSGGYEECRSLQIEKILHETEWAIRVKLDEPGAVTSVWLPKSAIKVYDEETSELICRADIACEKLAEAYVQRGPAAPVASRKPSTAGTEYLPLAEASQQDTSWRVFAATVRHLPTGEERGLSVGLENRLLRKDAIHPRYLHERVGHALTQALGSGDMIENVLGLVRETPSDFEVSGVLHDGPFNLAALNQYVESR